MESASSAILDTLYSLIFAEDEALDAQPPTIETVTNLGNTHSEVPTVIEKVFFNINFQKTLV
jgi:hypothetical protein